MDKVLRVGSRLVDGQSGVTLIVVKPPSSGELVFAHDGATAMLLGKRYLCRTCGAEVLVAKGGSASATCDNEAMERAKPKALPASD